MKNSIIRYPLPLLGLNTINPYADHDSGYARELTNYALKDGRIFLRPSIRNIAFNSTIVNGAFLGLQWFDPTVLTYDAILSDGSIVNYTTNTPIAAALTVTRITIPTEVKFSGTATSLNLIFGLVRAATPNQPLNKTTPFASAGPTCSVTLGSPACGCSHKGRLYYANTANRIEFGNVGQVAGAMPAANFFDVEQFMNGQSILRMFSISLSPGLAPSQNVFVIFGTAGRVLVFEGDNPGSATWNLIAADDMPQPISRRGFVEIDSDIFVATTRYAYWFKDLFSSGAQGAYGNSPSLPIENLWQSVGWNSATWPTLAEAAHIFYSEDMDAIVCQCSEKNAAGAELSNCFNYFNEAVSFAYFRKYKAWALWATTPFFLPVIANGSVLYGGGYRPAVFVMSSINTPGFDEYIDETVSPMVLATKDNESSWKTPYAFLEKGIGIVLSSARVWAELEYSDSFVSIFKSRAIFNFSDLNAPYGFFTQSGVTAIDPGRYTECATSMQVLTYNQYQPLLQLGGDGSCLSMQISFQGDIPDPGYVGDFKRSIYALSALVVPGSEIF